MHSCPVIPSAPTDTESPIASPILADPDELLRELRRPPDPAGESLRGLTLAAPQASHWRSTCKRDKEDWEGITEKADQQIAEGFYAFACAKTAPTNGSFCAELYANRVKDGFAVPAVRRRVGWCFEW
jgi:hypothetical protein